eukprot:IDg15475t1
MHAALRFLELVGHCRQAFDRGPAKAVMGAVRVCSGVRTGCDIDQCWQEARLRHWGGGCHLLTVQRESLGYCMLTIGDEKECSSTAVL